MNVDVTTLKNLYSRHFNQQPIHVVHLPQSLREDIQRHHPSTEFVTITPPSERLDNAWVLSGKTFDLKATQTPS
jgi:hypothetical protein